MPKPLPAKSYFQKRLKWRFKLPRDEADKLENEVMSKLFMGKLKLFDEDDRGIKIRYPILHKQCVLVFNKQKMRLRTAYKRSRIYEKKNKYLTNYKYMLYFNYRKRGQNGNCKTKF